MSWLSGVQAVAEEAPQALRVAVAGAGTPSDPPEREAATPRGPLLAMRPERGTVQKPLAAEPGQLAFRTRVLR